MLQIGDVYIGSEVGFVGKNKVVWAACESCGRERWVPYRVQKQLPRTTRCGRCARLGQQYSEARRQRMARAQKGKRVGAESSKWKGGRRINQGYLQVYVSPDDFYFPMTWGRVGHGGYVFEHRLIVAQSLNRCLLPWEVVHHRNGVKTDNNLANLELLSINGKHNTLLNREIHRLQKQNEVLSQALLLLWNAYRREELVPAGR